MVTRVGASKSRVFRLRAKIGCPTFLIYLQLQCYPVNIRKHKIKIQSFSRFPVFLAHTVPYRKRKKEALLVGFELTCHMPNPLHHSGQYIRHSISNKLASSAYSAKFKGSVCDISLYSQYTPSLMLRCAIIQYPVSLYILVSSANIFSNCLDPDQARQNVGPVLDPDCLTLWSYS